MLAWKACSATLAVTDRGSTKLEYVCPTFHLLLQLQFMWNSKIPQYFSDDTQQYSDRLNMNILIETSIKVVTRTGNKAL